VEKASKNLPVDPARLGMNSLGPTPPPYDLNAGKMKLKKIPPLSF